MMMMMGRELAVGRRGTSVILFVGGWGGRSFMGRGGGGGGRGVVLVKGIGRWNLADWTLAMSSIKLMAVPRLAMAVRKY